MPGDVGITIKYGGQQWTNVPFDHAARILESHIKAERDACDWHVRKLNEDHWIVSFWAEVLGGAQPPTHADWIRPLTTLDSARSACRGIQTCGPLADRQTEVVKAKFKQAVGEFNDVHKKWITYRNRIELGGERAITIMEVTIATLSAAAGGAIGGSVRAGAAVSASFKAVEESAKGLGMFFYGLDDKVDIAKILKNVGEELIKSLVMGKLAEKFLGVLAPRLSATWKIDPELARAMAKPGVGSRAQKFLTDFFSNMGYNIVRDGVANATEKAKGKKMSMNEFMRLVADEMIKQMTTSNASKQAWLDFAKNYATK